MFERFSSSSIRALMLAHEQAIKLGMKEINSALITYGISAELTGEASKILHQAGAKLPALNDALRQLQNQNTDSAQFVPIEFSFSVFLKEAINRARSLAEKAGSNLIEPEHILFEILEDPSLRSLIVPLLIVPVESVQNRVGMLIGLPDFTEGMLLRPQAEVRAPQQKAEETRSLKDWFSNDAIEVISKAEDIAASENSNKITADHMLRSVLPACQWLPEEITIRLTTKAATAIPLSKGKSASKNIKTKNARAPVAIEFSTEIIAALMSAKKEALQLSHLSLEPGHILLGLLQSISKEQAISCQCSSDLAAELYRPTQIAFGQWLRQGVVHRPTKTRRPLVVNQDTVLATKRCVETIKKALQLTAVSPNQTFEMPFILSALIDAARHSEVAFVQNHETSLLEAEKTFAPSLADTADLADSADSADLANTADSKDFAIWHLEKLQAIMLRAKLHAERLQSDRLDINHIGLALLEEDGESIDAVVQALGKSMSRECVKRRLDFCLFFQKFQPGHQAEDGEEVNLSKLELLG